MDSKTQRYFDNQLILLESYKKEYAQYQSLINKRKDKIEGAIEYAKHMSLLSFDDVEELNKRLYAE